MAFLRSALAPGMAMVAAAMLWGANPLAYSTFGAWSQPQMPYVVNSANLDLPGISAENAVRAGADVWMQQSNAFRFVYGGPSVQTTNTLDNINLVLFRNATSAPTNAIATAYTWSTSHIVEADIVFWDAGFQFFSGASGCSGGLGFYIEDIAAHEFGHALGLLHSATTGATMYPTVSACSTALRTLDADDIAGARALYPLPMLQPPTGLRFVK